MKDVVIIADFCSAFDGKGNNRFVYIAENLLKKDFQVEIVTSDFFHSDKKYFNPIIKDYKGLKVTMLHEPAYQKNVSIKRFLAHYKWGKEVGKYLKNRKKPDVVYCAIPTLKAASVAGKYCNKYGIKFIVDIQDLWPEAFKMVFNVPIISSILFWPFKILVNKAYRRADEIVGVSQTYVNRALKVSKKVKEGHSVFLGTDIEKFDRNVEFGQKLKKDKHEIWLGYCGSLGTSYDLSFVFAAMRKCNNPNLKFIIMGCGPKEADFRNNSLDLNVVFLGRLPYSDMCSVLNQCDIVVNPIKSKSAASIINKHADYAASGRPVLNTQNSEEYMKLVELYQMGFNVNDDLNFFSEKMNLLCVDDSLRNNMGKNSRRCAMDLFDRKKSYNAIFDLFFYD